MQQNTLYSIIKSWATSESRVNTTEEILAWVGDRNETVAVNIEKSTLSNSSFWIYDTEQGTIHNKNNSFFSITGFQKKERDGSVLQQPVILQQEIGFLGIICKEIDGIMHFLMQAKIEPGNVNKIQISPTIQATKSNFTQKHGGAKPPYLKYFECASRYEIVVDQIQSEQSSRFYKKRNRNIILRVEDEVALLPSHKWMTLGQIKKLMRMDNLVNMDTRTVLSCIPYYRLQLDELGRKEVCSKFQNKTLFRSIFEPEQQNVIPQIYQYINNYKMFEAQEGELIPLNMLRDWRIEDQCIYHIDKYPYQVIFCDIAMEGREVKQWTQPLFEAMGIATFGLICCEREGILRFLVRATPELGCFDSIELGPTVQKEAVSISGHEETEIDKFFFSRLAQGTGVFFDHLLSEEGGRFYHEQNRNILMKVDIEEISQLPAGYFWVNYRTLNELVQVNNTLNIQLRNLLSLLEV
ncbi:NDP-hexose 2,3-dehydratase family protein [Agathobaculum sp. LCP25S3_E8]|uniref:NDP-hexose 2,3-dehydratase family protein n=1 Tax=Agathobaculum sp. LCP25S3_E8 TaxID=3438735 RepID=UPI003F8E29D8